MIRTLAVLCLMAAPAFGLWEKGHTLTFSPNIFAIGKDGFRPQPQSPKEAEKKGFIIVEKPPLPAGYESLVLWCPKEDYSQCLFFDDNGLLSGLQISIRVDKFQGAIFDWAVSGFVSWAPVEQGQVVKYQSIQQFYVSRERLTLDPETRMQLYNKQQKKRPEIFQDGIFLVGFNREIYNLSTSYSEFLKQNDFTKQACIPLMGQHFYYKMRKDLICKAETVFVWFPLWFNEQIMGIGFLFPGKFHPSYKYKNKFENPDKNAISMIVPTGPKCLSDYGDNPGVVTLHTYLVKDAHLLTCLPFTG